jgi:hypothetical protein
MKKALLLISVLRVLLLGACKITVSPGLFTDFSESPSPTEEPAETEAPTLAPPSSEPAESPDVTAPPPAETEEQSGGLLGEVQGNMYVNKALGFSAAIPEGWEVATKQEMDALYGISTEYFEKTTELESGSQTYIFYCSKYGADDTGLNPNINVGISNQAETMAVIESEETFNIFLDQYKPMIESMYGSEVDLKGERGLMINDKEYSVIHVSGDLNGTHLWQDQYFAGAGGYALIITVTYFDEQDSAVGGTFLNGMQYEG